MGVEIKDTSTLEVALEEMGRDKAMGAANRAFSWSQENLYEGGDELDYEVQNVAQSGFPPEWDDSAGEARFGYVHKAARFFEDGTQTHEVIAEGDPLAFEWPEAPPDVRKMFESTFPTVFFRRTESMVDGIEAIRYVSDAMDDAGAWLEGS